jgi:hypothetical protein
MSDGMASLEEIFEGEKNAPETTAVEPTQATPEASPAETKPEAEAGQPRDEHGRFAPKAESQPAVPTADAAPVTPAVEQPKPEAEKKPLTPDEVLVLIDLRRKAQAAEERAAKTEAEAKAIRERFEQPTQPLPNPNEDPDAYAQTIMQQVAQYLLVQKVNSSEAAVRASGKYEQAEIDAAIAWGMEQASDPGWKQRAVSQLNPVEWTIQQYKRDQHLSQVGDDPDAWALKRAAELAAAQAQQSPQPSPAAPQNPAPVAPPPPTRSLASATSAGGISAVVDPGQVPLEQIFGR